MILRALSMTTLSIRLTNGEEVTLVTSPITPHDNKFRLQEPASITFDETNERGGVERTFHFFNSILIEDSNQVYTNDQKKYLLGELILL